MIVDCVGADPPGLSATLGDGARVGLSALVLDTREPRLSAACRQLAVSDGEIGSRVLVRRPVGSVESAIADQVDAGWTDQLARALAALVDGSADPQVGVPEQCRLLDLLGLDRPDAARLQEGWAASDGRAIAVVGTAADGPVELDLDRDGPHVLVAGTTGSGKSEFLQTMIAALAARYPPREISFVLIDYKGGAAFAECARLPHAAGLVTDLDQRLTQRALSSLKCELRRRERRFARSGASDLAAYRRSAPAEPLARLIIVVDEFAALADELPAFLHGLVSIARRGRSLGVHLVLATQRPNGVVSPEIRANTALRVALRMASPAESADVLDGPQAASLDRANPGRAWVRRGSTTTLMQTAQVSAAARDDHADAITVDELDSWRRLADRPDEPAPDATTDLRLLVAAAHDAARRAGEPAVHRPWLPPLPSQLNQADVDGRAAAAAELPIGLIDWPDRQLQLPFLLDLQAGGGVLITGTARSGRSTALQTIATTAAARLGPDQVQLHAIDWSGGALASLRALPSCGTVALAADGVELSARLLTRLDEQVRRRQQLLARWGVGSAAEALAAGRRLPLLLVVLDGWEPFVSAADEHDAGRTVDRLLSILRAAAAVGLTIVIAGDRGTLAPRLTALVTQRLVLRLADRADLALAGLPALAVGDAPPPGRAVRVHDHAEIQLATPPVRLEPAGEPAHPQAPNDDAEHPLIRLRPLPRQVALANLPRHPGRLWLGVAGDAAEPLGLDLAARTGPLLVAGPPRSGRSTVLHTLFAQANAAGLAVVVVAPTRSPVFAAARASGRAALEPRAAVPRWPTEPPPALVLVDDCEQCLDTPLGDALTAWVERHAAGTTVVVAGRSDELAVAFRGLGAIARRGAHGVLLRPGPGDGDVFGLRLPRTRSLDPPGRGLLVEDSDEPIPIQIAEP